MILSSFIQFFFSECFLARCVHYHKHKHQNKVKYQYANSPSKAPDVAASDALAEKDAVVVVAVDANIAIVAVLHIFVDVDVALDAVKDSYFVSLRILPRFVLRLVVLALFGRLQRLFSLVPHMKVFVFWRSFFVLLDFTFFLVRCKVEIFSA